MSTLDWLTIAFVIIVGLPLLIACAAVSFVSLVEAIYGAVDPLEFATPVLFGAMAAGFGFMLYAAVTGALA